MAGQYAANLGTIYFAVILPILSGFLEGVETAMNKDIFKHVVLPGLLLQPPS